MAGIRDLVINILGEDRTDRATRGVLRNIRRIKGALGTLGDVGGGLAGALGKAAGPAGIALAASLAATAAPLIITGIAAAVQAGGVLGMVGLAAYLQRDNPALKAAVAKMKKTVSEGLKEASAPLADDFTAAVKKVTASANRNMPLVAAAFKAVEPSISKFTDGVIGFVEGAGPGFVRMLEKSQPVMDAIALGLPQIGKALGTVFDQIGDDAPENAQAMRDLIDVITVFIVLTASSIRVSATAYRSSRAAFLGILQVVGQAMALSYRAVERFVIGTLRGLATVADATGADGLARKLRVAADKVEDSGKAIRAEFARIQAKIDALHGKTITVNVAVKKQQGSGNAGYIKQAGIAFATSTWAGAMAGAADGRTQAPAQPALVNATTKVYLDSAEIKAVARTVVTQESSRQAWRANVGRR